MDYKKIIYIVFLIASQLAFNDFDLVHSTEVRKKGFETSFPAEQKSTLTALKELDAQQNGKFVEVQGEVENISPINLNGFITIYLLGGDGEVVAAEDVSIIENSKLFAPGEVIAFTVTLEVPAKKKIVSVSVDFTKE